MVDELAADGVLDQGLGARLEERRAKMRALEIREAEARKLAYSVRPGLDRAAFRTACRAKYPLKSTPDDALLVRARVLYAGRGKH